MHIHVHTHKLTFTECSYAFRRKQSYLLMYFIALENLSEYTDKQIKYTNTFLNTEILIHSDY